MKVIVGLGNPGTSYMATRHNIGFLIVQRLGKIWKALSQSSVCSSKIAEGTIRQRSVRLVWPQTFMNASGTAVGCLVRRWKLKPEDLLVVCDDAALPLGMIRVRGQGSEGGHHGLASIAESLGSRQFSRLRVGIGGANDLSGDLTGHVLGRFAPPEKAKLEEAMVLAMAACECWVADGIQKAMNRFNRKVSESAS